MPAREREMSQRTFDPARCIENLFRGNAKPINRLFPFLRFPPTSGAFRRIVGKTRRLIIAPIISSVSDAVNARENGETPATFPAAGPAAVLQGRRFIDRESVSAAEWRKTPIQDLPARRTTEGEEEHRRRSPRLRDIRKFPFVPRPEGVQCPR